MFGMWEEYFLQDRFWPALLWEKTSTPGKHSGAKTKVLGVFHSLEQLARNQLIAVNWCIGLISFIATCVAVVSSVGITQCRMGDTHCGPAFSLYI